MSETFVCGHGRTFEVATQNIDPECEADTRALLAVAKTGTGEERERALRDLLEAPVCVKFDLIHEVTVALVGRDVWTHEFARPKNLYREALTQEHPADLEAHVIGSLDQLMGSKPVVVVRPDADA
jgi:hypothetical protein